jgi:hypothetical protein
MHTGSKSINLKGRDHFVNPDVHEGTLNGPLRNTSMMGGSEHLWSGSEQGSVGVMEIRVPLTRRIG